MSLRNAVLGLLSQAPMTGFDLVREFDIARSVIWPAPQNEVYRVLAALAGEGLIEEHATGARGARSYAITAAGRERLMQWLAAPSDYTLRYDPVLKAVFLRDAPPDVRLARAKADLAFFQEQLVKLQEGPGSKHAARRRDALNLALGLYRALAAWSQAIVDEGADPEYRV